MWFVWMSVGAFIGVFAMCLVRASSGSDCINCQGIIDRDADIRSIERSRDNFRERCEQLECLVHSLRTKLGIKNHKEGQEFYKRLGVAG